MPTKKRVSIGDIMKKNNKSFAKKLIPWIITAVVIYTLAAFILQFYNGTEISPTLTTAYFSFWGVELISLATIKNNKTKKQPNESEEE